MKYIALLRGVNVGGKTLKMADLLEVLKSKGFQNVRTYIQSGNIIFDENNIESGKLSVNIENIISKAFGISVNVIIRTEKELEKIVNNNPLIKTTNNDIDKLHVTFLRESPLPGTIQALETLKDKNEQYILIGKEVYLYCPNGYGKTKLNNANLEKKLKTIATTRNWKTTLKLLDLSGT
jgi:uncharacterized protein (DUF1697 family)